MVFSSLTLECGHWHLYPTTGRLCSAVHADKPGRENEWVAPDETELPSMRCPHANEHDNRRKVMSDRVAMVCHKCNHVGFAGYETMTTKRTFRARIRITTGSRYLIIGCQNRDREIQIELLKLYRY